MDAPTGGFKKPLNKDCYFFGSLDSLQGQKRSTVSSNPQGSLIGQDLVKRAFSTEAVMEAKETDSGDGKKVLASTLSEEEMMKMNFYSKFTPTSVSLSHFLDHSSGGGTIEDSFVFLRREIPVRLANMMMELEVWNNPISYKYCKNIWISVVTRGTPEPACLPRDHCPVWSELPRHPGF